MDFKALVPAVLVLSRVVAMQVEHPLVFPGARGRLRRVFLFFLLRHTLWKNRPLFAKFQPLLANPQPLFAESNPLLSP